MSNLEDVYQAWQNNPTFREQFKKDPEKALETIKVILSPEDLKKIHAYIEKKSGEDGALSGRINK